MSVTYFEKGQKKRTYICGGDGILDSEDIYRRIIPENRKLSTHFLITDSIVNAIHADRVMAGFVALGIEMKKYVFPAGESFKNMEQFLCAVDFIISNGVDKQSIVVSLGGGVVNNLAGFVASTVYRGIGLAHIATTVMAQLDAAIDTKQAVNFHKGKNLIGTFYSPSVIVNDYLLLKTLPQRHVLNGISEAIKHSLSQDADFYHYLMSIENDKLSDMQVLGKIISTTVDLKVTLLNGSPYDDQNEMIQQYGHCIGHSIEHTSKYNLYHGEAIAIGMCVSAEIGVMLGTCTEEEVKMHLDIFQKYNLPTFLPDDLSVDAITNTLKNDKHYLHSRPHMGLVEKIGSLKQMQQKEESFAWPVSFNTISEALRRNKLRNTMKSV